MITMGVVDDDDNGAVLPPPDNRWDDGRGLRNNEGSVGMDIVSCCSVCWGFG